MVPENSSPSPLTRNPTKSVSPDSLENRSFFYFQTQTLPKWIKFFNSDLWSQKILQLSHLEHAIKHGVLALSAVNERFENPELNDSSKVQDFAFVQYMRAVQHSNDLLHVQHMGKTDMEKVLVACVIFTCYENLAGDYRASNMHLQNGLRILEVIPTTGKCRPNSCKCAPPLRFAGHDLLRKCSTVRFHYG
jgi:hypothetical protein